MGELVRAMTKDGFVKAVAVTTTDMTEREWRFIFCFMFFPPFSN